jgi:hypothetical protein
MLPPVMKIPAPGPAAVPGSEWFIATAIYFHGRRTGALNIGGKSRGKKSRESGRMQAAQAAEPGKPVGLPRPPF